LSDKGWPYGVPKKFPKTLSFFVFGFVGPYECPQLLEAQETAVEKKGNKNLT
jgi:hypothetical protein